MQFIHPSNNYIEKTSAPFLWCLLFGPLYFLSKGAIGHAVISFIVAICTAGLSWFVYPFFAAGAIRKAYLRSGWTEIRRTEKVDIEQAIEREYRPMRTSHAR